LGKKAIYNYINYIDRSLEYECVWKEKYGRDIQVGWRKGTKIRQEVESAGVGEPQGSVSLARLY